MYFKQYKRVEYEKNILFEVVFQARFPEIMKISHEDPTTFQDIIRKEGFPESGSNISHLPTDLPEQIKKLVSGDKAFLFFSEEKNWQVSLANSFVALACKGIYLNYTDFKRRLEYVLNTFFDIYQPSYFSRIGLRYRNIVNDTILPLNGKNVKDCIPYYIFPELTNDIAKDVTTLEKTSQFSDGCISANVSHALVKASGIFGLKQISNEESYIIDIDCFYEDKIREIEDVIARCDTFKNTEWNIFQWSITDVLRKAMVEKK